MATTAQALQSSPQAFVLTEQRTPQYLKLRKRHRAFVDCYFRSFNATEAALAIGCTPKSAAAMGSRYCRDVSIRSAIDAEMEMRAEASGLTATFVLNSIRTIAEHEKTRNADKLTALTLLGKHLRLFAEQMDVNITHDLADRVAQARARVTERNGTALVPKLLANDTNQ